MPVEPIKLTLAPASKNVPFIVKLVPLAPEKLVGDILETFGGGERLPHPDPV